MTKDEIKQEYSMRDIAARYDLYPNRAGFIPCPFHTGDRQASLKVYDRDYHCFGCGANGDIFDFVMRMDDLTFPEAYQTLGGTYEKPDYKAKLAIYRAKKRRETERKRKERIEAVRCCNNLLIRAYRTGLRNAEPLSDAWCDCYNALQKELYRHEILNEPR